MRRITWVASYPKSGNTWVRLFIAAYACNGAVHLNALPKNLSNSDVEGWRYQLVSPVPVDRLTQHETVLLRNAALMSATEQTTIRPLLMKTHWARVRYEGIEAFPPFFTGPSVYVVRDPRDVAVSLSGWLGLSIDDCIAFMANEEAHIDGVKYPNIKSYMGSWSAHAASWGSRDDVLVIRYEDLLKAPEKAFTGVLEHIGTKPDKRRVKRSVQATTFDALKRREADTDFAERPKTVDSFFRSGKSGQWKEVLSPEQARRIETDHGEVMAQLGYDV